MAPAPPIRRIVLWAHPRKGPSASVFFPSSEDPGARREHRVHGVAEVRAITERWLRENSK